MMDRGFRTDPLGMGIVVLGSKYQQMCDLIDKLNGIIPQNPDDLTDEAVEEMNAVLQQIESARTLAHDTIMGAVKVLLASTPIESDVQRILQNHARRRQERSE